MALRLPPRPGPQVREELYGVPIDKTKRESSAQLLMDLYLKVRCQLCARERPVPPAGVAHRTKNIVLTP